MKFTSYLTEATLLKRKFGFLVEIALVNNRKLIIRCPNLEPLKSCDILGTRIWYSSASGFNCLPTWELAEVDGGHLVCVNKELMKPLFNEALKTGVIKELEGYKHFHVLSSYEEKIDTPLMLLENEGQPCYVGLEHVTLADESGNAFFPDRPGLGIETLDKLISIKNEGCKAVLCYCVMHEGALCVKPAKHIDSDYKAKLQEAINAGVEVIAYKSFLSLDSVGLTLPIPICMTESISNG